MMTCTTVCTTRTWLLPGVLMEPWLGDLIKAYVVVGATKKTKAQRERALRLRLECRGHVLDDH
jgi:hypothetical protein